MAINLEDVGGKIQMDLLWENPNKGQSFAQQGVYLDLSAYDAVFMTFRTYATITALGPSVFAPLNTTATFLGFSNGNSLPNMFTTRAIVVNPNGVSILSGVALTQSFANAYIDNLAATPEQIYGVKL